MKRIGSLAILTLVLALPLPAPQFNLTSTELRILTTWLYGSNGYLDFSCRVSDGQCGRQAWELDNAIDFVQWVRDNPQLDPSSSEEAKMVWWIRENDQVNIPVPQRPPESAVWASILQGWDDTIDAGFARAPQNERNFRSTRTFDENSCPIGWASFWEQDPGQNLSIGFPQTVTLSPCWIDASAPDQELAIDDLNPIFDEVSIILGGTCRTLDVSGTIIFNTGMIHAAGGYVIRGRTDPLVCISTGSIPSGSHLALQQQIINKVLGVLQ